MPTFLISLPGSLRALKAVLVLLIGLFALLVGLNNIVDYGSNFMFVQHVLSMDTTFEGNTLMGRAVTSSALQHGFYWIIISCELGAGVLCTIAAWLMFAARNTSFEQYFKAVMVASWGLTLGLLLWFGGFMIVGAEWFLMWQSSSWNGQEAAFRFIVSISITLVFLHLPEPIVPHEH